VDFFEVGGKIVPAPPNMRLRDMPESIIRVYGGLDPREAFPELSE
jgi:hypothetical protein